MKIEVDLDDLNNYGLVQVIAEMLGRKNLGAFDWALAGQFIEDHKMSLSYMEPSEKTLEIAKILGENPEPWSADMRVDGELYSQFGEDALSAVAKTYIAYQLAEGYPLRIGVDQVFTYVKDPSSLKLSLIEDSDVHAATAVPNSDTYILTPISDALEDLENFQSAVRMARRLQGDGVSISKSHTEKDSGNDYISELWIDIS